MAVKETEEASKTPPEQRGRTGSSWRQRWLALVLVGLMVAFIAGYIVGHGSDREVSPGPSSKTGETEALFWTCSMHPQIRQPGPGQCPICAMELIPVHHERGATEMGERVLTLSKTAQQLAQIETQRVERRFVEAKVRVVGRVDYDETRVVDVTARVAGRLDRLFVDYTGTRVTKDDHLVSLYSPDLLAGQQELLQALEALNSVSSGVSDAVRRSAEQTVEAVREKLRLWGLTVGQIREIERRGIPVDHLTMYAPSTGVVIEKHAHQGSYVKEGTTIYTVADLSSVWVLLEAYETDLPWVRYGQTVTFETEAYPGERFEGRIAFIDPVVNEKTRTITVRVNASNQGLRLKPGMFVRATIQARLAENGTVADPDLVGKWISPMHPEIVKDEPGTCDVCGMALVPAESLGYASVTDVIAPLVIPVSAPLLTGKRAVVYVEDSFDQGTYEGREITLGPRAGDVYVVRDGLREGEAVVVNGTFKIDSALQILARPSMMSPDGRTPAAEHQHVTETADVSPPRLHELHMETHAGTEQFDAPPEFQHQVADVLASYFSIQEALAGDDLEGARQASGVHLQELTGVDSGLLEGEALNWWIKQRSLLESATQHLAEAETLHESRTAFYSLSDGLREAVIQFNVEGSGPIYAFHCPMAFDNRGADWLSGSSAVRNPYFGASMLTCGSLTDTLHAGRMRPEGMSDQ